MTFAVKSDDAKDTEVADAGSTFSMAEMTSKPGTPGGGGGKKKTDQESQTHRSLENLAAMPTALSELGHRCLWTERHQ